MQYNLLFCHLRAGYILITGRRVTLIAGRYSLQEGRHHSLCQESLSWLPEDWLVQEARRNKYLWNSSCCGGYVLVAAEAKWWLLRRLCGSCCGGYVVVLTKNNATSWPILQAEAFRFSAKLKFQDGPSVAIIQSLWP